MLDKVSLFNFFGGIILFYVLGLNIPEVGRLLYSYNFDLEVAGSKFTFLNVAIPFIVAMISRIIKLHDKISDLLRIRERYDINCVIKPIILGVNKNPSEFLSTITIQRREILEKIFYKYTSTDQSNCKINHHFVVMVMDQMAWYWIFVEYLFLVTISIIIGFIFWNIQLIIGLVITWLVLFFFSKLILRIAKKYTKIEVNQIVSNPPFAKEIKKVLNELQD